MAIRRLELHWKILIGFGLGLAVGLLLNLVGGPLLEAVGERGAARSIVDFAIRLNAFVGDLFLRGLRFVAVPIVLFSLIAGTASLNDLRKLGRIGGKTVGIYLATTAFAITIGLVLATVVRPGELVPEGVRERLAEKGAVAAERLEATLAPSAWETLLNVVPTNPFEAVAKGEMLQVVFFAVVLGVALTLIPSQSSAPIVRAAEALTEAVIKLVHLVMLLAPFAVFSLMAKVVAEMGLEVLGALAAYSLTVVAGLAVMILAVYPALIRLGAGMGLRRFYRAIAPAQLLAFSSSSSVATLPVTIDCVEDRLGVSAEVTSFAIPLGATINMDGTALYQGVAAMFIAQLYAIDLTFGQQLTIVLTATLASIGTAGVPGVGIVMLVIVLQSIGLAPDMMQKGVAIIFGVDRLLDMCRTTCNVTGDCAVAVVVANSEGALLSEEEVDRRLAKETRRGIDENP